MDIIGIIFNLFEVIFGDRAIFFIIIYSNADNINTL